MIDKDPYFSNEEYPIENLAKAYEAYSDELLLSESEGLQAQAGNGICFGCAQ